MEKLKLQRFELPFYTLGLLAAGVILFFPMFLKLFSYGWKNADYDHGIFIVPISALIIFLARGQLVLNERVKPMALAAWMASFFIYIFALRNDFLFLQAMAFCGVVLSIFYLRFTPGSLKGILFPLVYLMFMIPPPGLLIDALTFPLKQVSIQCAYVVLNFLDVPVTVRGAILSVARHELLVTDACSGFRSITTLLALGAVYAYYQPISIFKKWVLFLSVIPLGIIGNVIRLVVTGELVYNFGPKYGEGFFHETSGIIVFVFTIISLLILKGLIAPDEEA